MVVLHIPHASRHVPSEERHAILLDDAGLDNELLRMTDAYTDELFPITAVEASRVAFPISRLARDVGRFSSDDDEPMAARGMGVSCTRTSTGGLLRAQPSATDRQSILDRWYWPHHSQLDRIVNPVVARCGCCLIVDCHSFPSVPLPHEPHQAEHRSDFCIGTDSFHTPPAVTDVLVDAVKVKGYSVTLTHRLREHWSALTAYQKDRRASSVMIEVNRRLYMDERSGSKNLDFDRISAMVGTLIVTAAAAAARLCRHLPGDGLP